MSKKDLEVYPIGTMVSLGQDGTVGGNVTAIKIGGSNYVAYEVGYWDKSEYKTVVLEEFQVLTEQNEKLKIGFRSQS